METLGDLRERVSAALDAWTERADRLALGVRLLLVLGGALAAGVAGLWPDPPDDSVPWPQIIGVIGAAAAFLGGVILVVIERGFGKQLRDAEKAIDVAVTKQREIERREAELERARTAHDRKLQHVRTTQSFLDVADQTLASQLDISQAIDSLFNYSERPLVAAMGCEPGEAYVISVFQWQEDQGELTRISARYSDRSSETEPTRSWGPGEGFSGTAWQRNAQIVIEDTYDGVVKSVFHVPDDKTRPYDEERYVSVVCIPIRPEALGETMHPWGILTVTSDRFGRFAYLEGEYESSSVEVVRSLGKCIELLVGIAMMSPKNVTTTLGGDRETA